MCEPGSRSPFTLLIMTNDTGAGRPASNAVQVTVILAAALVVIALVAAAVALSLTGRDVAFIIGLLGPLGVAAGGIVAALGQLASLRRQTNEQTDTLNQVAHQTNGALRAHVTRAAQEAAHHEVRAALTEWFGAPKNAPTAPVKAAPVAKTTPRKRAR